jgi:uncharacterized membrane protein (UPF0127 family)
LIVVVGSNGQVVCERCHVADTALGRMRGLLGRRILPPGEGILLRPANSVHTAFMRFPIDVVFLGRTNEVLAVRHELEPWRLAWAAGARAALELAAGECERRDVRPRDRLGWGVVEVDAPDSFEVNPPGGGWQRATLRSTLMRDGGGPSPSRNRGTSR